METLFSVLNALDGGGVSWRDARDRVASLGTPTLLRHLKTAGLAADKVPAESDLLADILLSLNRPQVEEILDKPKTVATLVAGKLFRADPPDLVRRIAVRRPQGVELLALYRGSGGQPRLETELVLSPKEVPKDLMKDIPETTLIPLEEDGLYPPPEEVVNREHVRIDIKLVYYIPYIRNELPLLDRKGNSIWEAAITNQEERLVSRLITAAGNPPPPREFPTKADWDRFVASKEYRGFVFNELFICCPPGRKFVTKKEEPSSGFTPPVSNVPPDPADTLRDRLTADHNERQNTASVVESLVVSQTGPGLTGPGGALLTPLADRFADAYVAIRREGKDSNESYSPGDEKIYDLKDTSNACLSGNFDYFVRVGKTLNALNYALVEKLIAYQGGNLLFELCCGDTDRATLKMTLNHSPIPSKRLYINNVMVWEYDMLTADWAKVFNNCFYATPGILALGGTTSLQQLLVGLSRQTRANLTERKVFDPMTFRKRPGCPDPVPTDWIYSPAAF